MSSRIRRGVSNGEDAFDGCDVAQCPQAFRREGTKGTPCTFELVDFGNQGQQFRRDLDGVCLEHGLPLSPISTPINTHKSSQKFTSYIVNKSEH